MKTGHTVLTDFAGAMLAFGLGVTGPATAAAGTTLCSYRATDGASQWTDRYVGRKTCPGTSTRGGAQGVLVSSEYIA